MSAALTKEEWDRQRGYVYEVGPEREWGERPHALAALCLHGQPFGFTRGDVSYLRTMADLLQHYADAKADPQASTFSIGLVRDIADRIEALLPPEERT